MSQKGGPLDPAGSTHVSDYESYGLLNHSKYKILEKLARNCERLASLKLTQLKYLLQHNVKKDSVVLIQSLYTTTHKKSQNMFDEISI